MKKLIFFLAIFLFGLITQKSSAQWQTSGNTLPGPGKLGTLNGYDLQFYANGTQYMDLQNTTGYLGIGSGYGPSHLLDVTGGDINVDLTRGDYGYMISGFYALYTGGIVNNNLMVGIGAGNTFLTGGQNTFVGANAGLSTSGGSNNTAVGFQALYNNTNLFGNTAIGQSALYTQAFNAAMDAGNVAVGNLALYTNNRNASAGGGIQNTAIGEYSLQNNSTGQENTANGYFALNANTTGSSNTANGDWSGYSSTGTMNTFMGDSAGWGNGGGYKNTYLGYQAGGTTAWTPVNNTVWIGYQSGPGTPVSNYVYVGNSTTTDISSYNAVITTWSDRRIKDDIKPNVPGLSFITKITPVTYHYNVHKENQLLGIKEDDNSSMDKSPVEQITQSGFIAQQVDSVAQACGYDFSGVIKPTTPNGAYALAYTEFIMPLVKSVQELSAKNDSLVHAMQTLQACINQICGATGNNSTSNTPASEQTIALSSTNAPVLYQNSPNPFNTGTKINYYLPQGTMGASIVFYDSYGNPIKTVQISETGNGTLTITADNLSSGIYSYSLIVNSSVIDTKRMVLQK